MRLELRASTEMTLRALGALADGRRWTAAELAEPAGTTPANAAHLVAPLVHAGWVRSSPGPTGGHELAVDLADISLLELIEAIEGRTDDGRCVMAHRPCPAPSPAQGAIVELRTAEDGLYPIVTHAFNFPGRGAVGLLQAGDGKP